MEDNDNQSAKILAVYYARQVGCETLIKFMGGEIDLASTEEAALVIKGFWQMTDLAIEDNHASKSTDGIDDIEFWMHKLFIKMNGYMARNGFDELWDASIKER